MDRMTGYEPVDSGSNPDKRIDIAKHFLHMRYQFI